VSLTLPNADARSINKPADNLDELTRMAVQYFSPILDRNLPPTPKIRPPPLGPEEMGVRWILYKISPQLIIL
jgi:hypothetical protein